tara:strand:- start:2739 stop:3602 length:864 start_codon:yes stop_codon:yes gene_type:complete
MKKTTMKKQKILVIGCGQMGSGIAQTAAEHNHSVFLGDLNKRYVKQAIEKIHQRWNMAADKGKRQKEEISCFKSDLHVFEDGNYQGFDFIIEAVSEDEKVKKQIFKKIGQESSEHTILGSNTSSISINTLGAASGFAERTIGIHFMNPVPVMELVEVIEGDKTNIDTIQKTLDFIKSIKKIPAKSKDRPGFISNKILMPMINEAILTLESGTGSKEDIDTVMELGMKHPMGPLKLADLIGLDTCLAIMNVLHSGFKEEKYKPAKLLVEKVDNNELGRKTGIGFYKYN